MVFPYSIRYRLLPADQLPRPAQVLIATSKHKFHHAVDRNRVKRLTRECYRLHKDVFYPPLERRGLSLVVSINYIHNEIMDYATLSHKFDKIVHQLAERIEAEPLPKVSMTETTTLPVKDDANVVSQAKENI